MIYSFSSASSHRTPLSYRKIPASTENHHVSLGVLRKHDNDAVMVSLSNHELLAMSLPNSRAQTLRLAQGDIYFFSSDI